MPPTLLSFCLGATYNVLPSPSYLKRWQVTSERRCFLSHKDVCTILHILGASKISLQQDRFPFRHDSVLHHLVLVLKSFLKDLPNNITKKCNTIKFVKSGEQFSKTSNFSKGVLHLVSHWILLADLKGDYSFPFQLAPTELRTDVLLFSESSKRAVLLELTCTCRKNMESWHSGFFNKGIMYYANSISQALSTIPLFQCGSASKSRFLSPLIRAVSLNMSLLKSRTTLLDPSNVLWALCMKLSTNKQVPFQFNTQQDVREILQVVVNELKHHYTIASNTLATSVRNSTTCDTWNCCNISSYVFFYLTT